MLDYFFSVDHAGRRDLFEGLFIWEEEGYRELQGTYPVISLSFARIKENNYEYTKKQIFQIIIDLYNAHRFLLEGDFLSDNDKEFFCSVSSGMPEYVATVAINKLSEFLCRYYGKKVIILLDEYDTPMQEAYVYGYWEETVSFLRSFFNSTFKTNPYMARGMMTGITRVSKESIFSDLNNLKVITATSDEYAAAFGFTQEEVFGALDEYGYSGRKEEIKRWYDGFIFGQYRDIYNPWSILNFLDTGKIGAYWANTSSNSLVSSLLKKGDSDIKQQFECLLRGETIWSLIDEQIVFGRLDGSQKSVWSLLLASGYLKVVSSESYEDILPGTQPRYELAITNMEINVMFRGMVSDWFSDSQPEYNSFIKALVLGDVDHMNDYMNEVTLHMFGSFDTGRQPSQAQPERFYHGFVLGLMVDMQRDYIVTSNGESGFGRYDVMIEPRDKKKDAFILEFKVFNKRREKSLEDTVRAAHAQIEEKQYEAALVAKGIPAGNIRKYGFAFEGKKVLIG